MQSQRLEKLTNFIESRKVDMRIF